MQSVFAMTDRTATDPSIARGLVSHLTRRLAVVAAICLAVVLVVEFTLADLARDNAKHTAREDLNRLRASLQQSLSRDVQLLRGMTGFVRANPNITPEEFRLIAQDILDGAAPYVRNLTLAKDLVISHMFPDEGNRGALGLDYRNTPAQWPAVERVISERRIIVAGPVNLVQGGVGLIARFPIFLRPDPTGARDLWGISSTVFDFPGLIEQSGYKAFEVDYRLALVGRDGDPTDGEIIWGDTDIRDYEPVALDVVIPAGSWRVLAAPRDGWPHFTSYLPYTVVAVLILTSIYGFWSAARYRLAAERTNASQEILDALQRAEEASAAKSTFLAVMSHELRTPLNAIIGFSELLENSPRDSKIWDRAPEYVSDIRQSGRFLLSIIDDILDLSRIESGRRNSIIEHLDIVPLMIESANRMRVEFEAKDIALSVSAEVDQIVVLADRRAVMQILTNLLNNALKYAGTAATVDVSARRIETGAIQITVRDDGPGIPEEKLDEIMKPFVQLSSSYARAAGGVGLGLTICQSLARTMGGSLVVESSLGHGTAVHLTLPASPAA